MFSNSFSVNSSLKRYDDKVMDRFIPSIASQHIYKSIPSDTSLLQDPLSARRLGFQHVRDSTIFNLSETSIHEGSLALNSTADSNPSSSLNGSPTSTPSPGANNRIIGSNSSPSSNSTRDVIAEALNFTPQNRVLHFTPTSNLKKKLLQAQSSGGCNTSNTFSTSPSSLFSASNSRLGLDQEYSSPRNSFDSDVSNLSSLSGLSSATTTPQKKKPIKSHTPYRVLDAPSLRNDFYTNLISWSPSTNRIAVGLSSHVYIWSEEEGACLLDIPDEQTISCVSFSDGDFIAVASKSGRISIFSQESQLLLDEYGNIGQGICCIAWVPNEPNKFYAGDEGGDVLYFKVVESGNLKLIKRFKCHQQQVCGNYFSSYL